MRTIKIKNMTGLEDFCVLTRAALYLCGDKKQAEEGGIKIQKKTIGDNKIIVAVKEDR